MDIVTRILEAIAERINAPETFTEAIAREIEEQIRKEYGGDRIEYVARCDRVRRNQRIQRDAAHGDSLDLLRRRYQLSARQLQRILSGGSDGAEV